MKKLSKERLIKNLAEVYGEYSKTKDLFNEDDREELIEADLVYNQLYQLINKGDK